LARVGKKTNVRLCGWLFLIGHKGIVSGVFASQKLINIKQLKDYEKRQQRNRTAIRYTVLAVD